MSVNSLSEENLGGMLALPLVLSHHQTSYKSSEKESPFSFAHLFLTTAGRVPLICVVWGFLLMIVTLITCFSLDSGKLQFGELQDDTQGTSEVWKSLKIQFANSKTKCILHSKLRLLNGMCHMASQQKRSINSNCRQKPWGSNCSPKWLRTKTFFAEGSLQILSLPRALANSLFSVDWSHGRNLQVLPKAS